MFRNTRDWAARNSAQFGQISLAFTVTFLWVMFVLLVINIASFSGATFDAGAAIDRILSTTPEVFAAYVPKLTADTGLWSLFTYFLTVCVIAPLVEETFRAGLLQFACEERHVCTAECGNGCRMKDSIKPKNVFVIIAMSFVFFGMIHGGYLNILIQGVLGLMLANLWFKGRYSAGTRYFSMVSVHAAYNFSMICIQVMTLRASI